MTEHINVSIVIPTYNAKLYIEMVLEAIFTQDYSGEVEVIVVNDGSTDDTLTLLKKLQEGWPFTILDQKNQGAVIATNNGFERASHDIILSIDSDVVIGQGWLKKIMAEFKDDSVGAVQGYYKTPKSVSFWAKMMGYDVEARYDAIPSKEVTQICTGDTAYRKTAIEKAGPFDPTFKYGYDNDMSYRLQSADFKLIFLKDAVVDHYWKADLVSYIKQQYRSAYGRMQLIRKHTDHITGDSVSGLRMMVQPPLTLLAVVLFTLSIVLTLIDVEPLACYSFIGGASIVGLILIDRIAFAIPIMRKQRDPSALLLPLVHILRNIIWTWAAIAWVLSKKD